MVMLRWLLARQPQNNFGLCIAGANFGYVVFNNVDKYQFSNNSRTASTSLSTGREGAASAGNFSFAIIAGGGVPAGSPPSSVAVVSSSEKFTYTTSAVSSVTSLSTARAYLVSAGNSEKAYFAGGTTTFSSVNTLIAESYTYNTDSVTSATSLTGTARRAMAGFASQTHGFFAGGGTDTVYFTTHNKYQFSDGAVTSATALSTGKYNMASAGNNSFGLITGGYTGSVISTSEKYTFSTNAWSSATALTNAVNAHAGFGNSSVAVFIGGLNSSFAYQSASQVYTYSSNTVAAGGSLGTARYSLAGVSTNPGHLS